jgi:hypothetical protein
MFVHWHLRIGADLTFILIVVFLGAFAKLRKATVSFVMYVCPSVSMEHLGVPLDGFSLNLIWVFFENLSRNFRFHYTTKITCTLHKDLCTFVIISRWFLRMRNVSDKSCVENQNTHFVINSLFFENRAVYEIIWVYIYIYCRFGLARDDSMAHAHCMLDNWSYKNALRICNTYCFSTAKMVARTRLRLTFYVHCSLLSTCIKTGCVLCGISGFRRTVRSVLFWDVTQLTFVVQGLSRSRLELLDPWRWNR